MVKMLFDWMSQYSPKDQILLGAIFTIEGLMFCYAVNIMRQYRSGREQLAYASLYRAETPEAGFRDSLKCGYRARKTLESGVRTRTQAEYDSRPPIDKPPTDEENSDVPEAVVA